MTSRMRRRVVRCPRCQQPMATTTPGPCTPCMAEVRFRLTRWRTRQARQIVWAVEGLTLAFGGLLNRQDPQ